MKKFFLMPTLLALLLPGLMAGQLGDPAAPLEISEWVKGGPVDLATVKGKQVVVVEFWATWCPPCRVSIPHLTKMQKKFKDVIFVGVSDEKPDVVKKFVTQMGDKMDYVVAIDDQDQTSKGYMAAFDIGGIPHAFVVGQDGHILWQGHPMDGLEEVLDQIIAGHYDLTAAQAQEKKAADQQAKQAVIQPKLMELVQLIQ
ncbi:MAG: TlpA family protein disulfide reductase [Verrucomicrobiae bacterium]|nr:TlpA family protein disulfide reductase [Verrucomicrobiae bacterium]